jgi:hypothetical protein
VLFCESILLSEMLISEMHPLSGRVSHMKSVGAIPAVSDFQIGARLREESLRFEVWEVSSVAYIIR